MRGLRLVCCTIWALGFALCACQPAGGQQSMGFQKDAFGMMIGNNKTPQRFTVGAGDSIERLMQRNPSLGKIQLPPNELLRLPLQADLDLHYDDGDLKLDVGCVSSINVDGNKLFAHASFIGAGLCKQPLNDWNEAIDLAVALMRRLEAQNPHVQDLRQWYANASEPELQKIGGPNWNKSTHEIDLLITPEQAREKFAKEAAGKHEETMSGRRRGTYASIAKYAGKKATFSLGIVKSAHFGMATASEEERRMMGVKLSEEQRHTMRYEITMNFKLRYDIDLTKLD